MQPENAVIACTLPPKPKTPGRSYHCRR
jgi:hypothetical protein